MFNHFDITSISLTILTFLLISSLSLLALTTLKEGRKALNEVNKDFK